MEGQVSQDIRLRSLWSDVTCVAQAQAYDLFTRLIVSDICCNWHFSQAL